MGGASPQDIGFSNNRIVNRKQKRNGNKNDSSFNNQGFLPNITGKAAQRSSSNDAVGQETKVIKDADTYLSTDIKQRDRQI